MLGVAAGVVSALVMSGLWSGKQPMEFSDVNVDGWVSDFAVGSDQASPYVRARVARHGLLALAKSEAVYFMRNADNAGRPLSEDCDYQISGGKLPAGWWSITLYQTSDSKLPDNDDAALSIDATSVIAESGAWSTLVAPQRPDGTANWISSRNSEDFDLLLRLYVPDQALLDSPESALSPPTIERLSCKGEAA